MSEGTGTGRLATLRRPARPTTRGSLGAYRTDIDGLRAVAITTVVAFHAGLPGVGGGFVGVDVFFVISGFLITGILADELQRTGTISIAGFYARRVRRLLPMSALVLAVTSVVAMVITAPTDRQQASSGIRAAGLFVSNLFFANQSTDYMAQDINQSPVLHFWSLSVEEQFYVLWPLLLIVLAWAGRRRRTPGAPGHDRRLIGAALAVVGLTSLALSIWLTPINAPWSYFGLHTRAWELAAGAGLALARPHLASIPRGIGVALGWLGLAAVLWAVVSLDRLTPYPGWAATLPVAGTVAIIAAGGGVSTGGAPRLLSLAPLRYVGRLSYSWYLWHWPFIIFATEWVTRRPGAGTSPSGLVMAAAVVGSFIAAVVSHRAVEVPLRRLPWLVEVRSRSLVLGAVLTATTVAMAAGLTASAGSAAVASVDRLPDRTPVAAATLLTKCNTHYEGVSVDPGCVFGDVTSSVNVALVGDSHGAQWAEPMIAIAVKQHWRLHVWTKSSCDFEDARLNLSVFKREYFECEQWRVQVMAQLRSIGHLAAVIVVRNSDYTGRLVQPAGRTESVSLLWQQAASRTVAALLPLTPHIIIFRETPRTGYDIAACVSQHASDPTVCNINKRSGTYTDRVLYAAEATVARSEPAVSFLDMTPVLCPGQSCPVVTAAGDPMYRDREHLQSGFLMTLVPALESRLVPLVTTAR